MSSFTKALKAVRRTHRERAQPAARAKLGLLEKRKDWKERRDNFHKKEATIKTLRQKAETRNPDEFYQDMIHARTEDGVHVQDRDTSVHLDHEELQLLKSQDKNYITLRRTQELKKIEKMKASLHFVGANVDADGKPLNSHTVFVDSTEEAMNFDAEQYFDTPAAFLADRHLRPKKDVLKETPVSKKSISAAKAASKAQAAAYNELNARMKRADRLKKVSETLDLERNLAGKGRRIKVKAGSSKAPPVYKWRKERKK